MRVSIRSHPFSDRLGSNGTLTVCTRPLLAPTRQGLGLPVRISVLTALPQAVRPCLLYQRVVWASLLWCYSRTTRWGEL